MKIPNLNPFGGRILEGLIPLAGKSSKASMSPFFMSCSQSCHKPSQALRVPNSSPWVQKMVVMFGEMFDINASPFVVLTAIANQTKPVSPSVLPLQETQRPLIMSVGVWLLSWLLILTLASAERMDSHQYASEIPPLASMEGRIEWEAHAIHGTLSVCWPLFCHSDSVGFHFPV